MKIYKVSVSREEKYTSPSYHAIEVWFVAATSLQSAVSKTNKRLRPTDEMVAVKTLGKLKIR